MKSRSTRIDIFTKSLIPLLTALLITSIYLSLLDSDQFLRTSLLSWRALSILCSMLIFTGGGVLLYLFNYKYFNTDGSIFLPLLFVSIILLDPRSIIFTKSHIIILLLLCGVLFSARYSFDRSRVSTIFCSTLFFSVASLFLPGLFFLAVVNILLNITKESSSPRYYLTVLSALILPIIYVISYRYVVWDAVDLNGIWNYILVDISSMSLPTIPDKATAIVLILYIMYLMFRSMVYLIGGMKLMNVNHERSLTIIIFLGLAIIIVATLYEVTYPVLSRMMMAIPVSYLIFYYFQNSGNSKAIRYSFWLLILLITFFRVNEFIGF